MTKPLRPEPSPSRDSAFFWEGLREDKLLCQSCEGCETLRHPPRPMCPHCGSLKWSPVTLSGRGRVHSWIKPVHPPLPMFGENHHVALIELEEGIRLLSNLCDVATEEIRNEMAVEVFYIPLNDDGARLHQFRPRTEAVDD
jgi:uncharacterized OB-fold protein